MSIVEFLLARIGEDEDGLTRTHRDLAEALRNVHGFTRTADWLEEQAARVLAECEAKRRIVEEWSYTRRGRHTVFEDGDNTLAFLAAVYADHPDYDTAWKELH